MEGINSADNINCFELFRQAQLGNQESSDSLAGLTREKLFVYIHRCTLDYNLAQDISQETVLQMIKSLKKLKFDSTESFWSWLYRTAMGKVLHHFRDRRNTVNMSALNREHLIQYASQNHPDGLKELINKELVEAVVEAMAGLKLRHRNILVLRCYERLSYSQIAAILGCSELAAQSLFYRARCLLGRRLSKRGFGKGMLLPALGLFGSLTAPADAAWATVAVSDASTKVGPSATIIGAAGSKLGITVAAAVIAVLVTAGVMNSIAKTEAVRETAAVVVSEPAVETAIPADSETIPETAAVVDEKPLTSADESTQNITNSLVADEPGETEFETGITGVVTDKGTSRPIEGAELSYRFSESRRSVMTDANGYFELLDMQPGEQQCVSVIAGDYTSQRMVVNIIKGEIYKDFKIELTPGAKVAGIVWGQDGEPLKAVTVKTFHFTNHPVVTGDDGEYEIDGLDPAFGTYYLHVSHPNYPAVRASFLSPGAGETVLKDVTLRPGVTIYGQITDVEGNPVADAEVGNTTSHSMWNCIKTKTDEDGLYELKKIPAGQLVLWVLSDEYAPYVGRFSLDSLQAEKLVNIELADPRAMHGQIIDKAGNPMPGVKVTISQYEGVESLGSHGVVSDDEGKFIIPNAPPTGKVTLSVWAENVPHQESELEMGREEYVITVDRTGRLYGKVVSDQTSEPVSVFNVTLGASRKGLKRAHGYSASWGDYGHYFKSIDGFFGIIESLPIGAAYRLTVYAEGYNPLTIDPVIVQEITDDPNRIEFRLKPATPIVGRVVGRDGLPVARARIRCLTDENKSEHYDDRDT
ncbi:MAG: sigma-70 family RNA polymerase sigma factor, partial [Planctomycetota bacterium]